MAVAIFTLTGHSKASVGFISKDLHWLSSLDKLDRNGTLIILFQVKKLNFFFPFPWLSLYYILSPVTLSSSFQAASEKIGFVRLKLTRRNWSVTKRGPDEILLWSNAKVAIYLKWQQFESTFRRGVLKEPHWSLAVKRFSFFEHKMVDFYFVWVFDC